MDDDIWILGTLLPFVLSCFVVGTGYAIWQATRRSQSFFTSGCYWRLILLQVCYLALALGIGYKFGQAIFTETTYWLTVFPMTILATIIHWFIFNGAHEWTMRYRRQRRPMATR